MKYLSLVQRSGVRSIMRARSHGTGVVVRPGFWCSNDIMYRMRGLGTRCKVLATVGSKKEPNERQLAPLAWMRRCTGGAQQGMHKGARPIA